MCGIIGYIGNNNAIDFLNYGLKALEYRGYDSAGVAFFKGKKLCVIKKAGTVDNLFKYVNKTSNIGIGHTRWATHGKATDVNSHPHQSQNKKVCIVHNGIIENYQKLKSTFLSDYTFVTQTDTEVICNLIEKFYLQSGNKLSAISKAIKMLKGSFALGILFDDESEKIYFAKNISPLLVGIDKNQNFISSDILGFGKFAKQYVDIDDMQYGYITKTECKIFNADGKPLAPKFCDVPQSTVDVQKNGYPHFMIKEINEIPQVISQTSKLYLKSDSPLNKIGTSFFKNIKRVKLIACGTSYHASLVGEKLLRKIGLDANAEIASEFIYANQVWNKNTLCIFISQSGETADTLTAVKLAKKHHAKTLAITNVCTSTITKMCNAVLPIKCGAEIAVASTKAYNAQICVLMILASYLKDIFTHQKQLKNKKCTKNGKKTAKNLQKTINLMQNLAKTLNINFYQNQIDCLVKEVITAKNIIMLGKDFDYVLAMESALKLKEISYLNCTAYASGELKHGTISLIDNSAFVFAFATQKKLLDKTLNIISQVKSRGGKVVLITQFDSKLFGNLADYKITLPKKSQNLYPIFAVVPMQLLAYKTSIFLGYNPDKPRNLAKSVTVE